MARHASSLRRCHLGIDIGGSSVKLSVLDEELVSVHEELHSLPDIVDDPAENRAVRVEFATRAIERSQHEFGEVSSVGVASPGIVDPEYRRVVSLPGKLAGLEGVDWGETLGSQYRVAVINDAHAALLGEARLGAGRGAQDLAMLTLGTGVGGGIMLAGKLLEGRNRRAGHLGHISLDPNGEPSVFPTPGTLEWHLGEGYIVERTGGRYRSNVELLCAVRAGATSAACEWRRMVRALAVTIASIINVLDCERVVLGGGLVAAGGLLMDPLARELDEVEWRPNGVSVPVVAAALGRHSGSAGAAVFGRERST